MKQLHSALNREHKLKHWGRLQYGLFLKGAGLGVDDAMAFWQVSDMIFHSVLKCGCLCRWHTES